MAWAHLRLPFSWEGHTGLCCSSWREQPREPLWGWESEPRLSISVSSFSGPPPTPPCVVPWFPWLLWGPSPRARAVYQADGHGLVPAEDDPLPGVEGRVPFPSRAAAGAGGRVGVVSGPLCGADKVRKLSLEWEEAQAWALSHGWGLQVRPSQASVTTAYMCDGVTAVALTRQ